MNWIMRLFRLDSRSQAALEFDLAMAEEELLDDIHYLTNRDTGDEQ